MTKESKATETRRYTLEQFYDSESIAGNFISFDGKQVLFSGDKTGIYNAYSVSVEDGTRTQLTHSEEDAVLVASFFPEDNRFLFLSDKGGNEILHIYVQNENGETVDLTPGEQERAQFYDWSKDSKSFFYGSNKRNPAFMDVYEMDIATFESTCIFTNDKGYEFGSISPDRRFISLVKVTNANDANIYIFNRETENFIHVTPHVGDVQNVPQSFSGNSGSLYYLTDENDEFLYLKKYHIESGVAEEVVKEGWDIKFSRISKQGTYLIYGVNQDASTVVNVLNVNSGQYLKLPELHGGQFIDLKFSADEKLIAFLYNSPTSPTNLYTYTIETGTLKKLTETLNPEISQTDLVDAEVIRYPSFDGLEIPSIYYRPNVKAGEKAPALVFVHGGPGGQSTTDYNPLFQYLANYGYAVLAVNNRGSSGYGKTFFSAADQKHGEIDLEDCIQAKTFLKEQEEIEGEKIGIIGGSYGGFMVLAALAFRPEEFVAGVDIFGVSNWERTLKSIPAWWESYRDALYKKMGNPYTQTDYIRSISPLFHADKINRPLIVLQGANDPRVLQVESDEIVQALQKNNVPVEYIVFSDEGHGFMKKENRIKGYGAVLEFLNTYLK
ncbi:S9 family peptidase [Neobacillus notoginsengisoli]|uniref:Acyl-peptide hydrolase n=1 Tax=Neobacillus notoginsengisoli TaxID=1578198 RepID=A0A417Z0C5_9BACI|nr:S9 family peptidase [Neobacillus notoginsengisoli]RHW43454.1 S9 family peptidase [Neobacillus notoginsengisoli]